jgi:hypothetical protein
VRKELGLSRQSAAKLILNMKYTVYKITHLPTSRYYIGVHGMKPEENLYSYTGSGNIIKLVINSHDINEFNKEILFTFSEEPLAYDKEKELVTLDTLKDPLCMNLTEGGKIPPRLTKDQILRRNRNVAKARKINGSYSDLSHWHTMENIIKRVSTRKENNNYTNPNWLQTSEVQNKARLTRKLNNNFNHSQLFTFEAREKAANKLRKSVYEYDNEGNFISEHIGLYKVARLYDIIPGKIQRNNDPLRIWLRERNDSHAKEISNIRKFND